MPLEGYLTTHCYVGLPKDAYARDAGRQTCFRLAFNQVAAMAEPPVQLCTRFHVNTSEKHPWQPAAPMTATVQIDSAQIQRFNRDRLRALVLATGSMVTVYSLLTADLFMEIHDEASG